MPKTEQDIYAVIYDLVRHIPKGRVSTYGAIANAIGITSGARMVGYAMNHAGNITPKVPAHRVVNRNGLLTGKHHFNPPGHMQQLLEKEGIQVENDKIIHFETLFWDPLKELNME